MPIGEIIGKIILRPIFELVFYGLTYWIGFFILKVITLGSIRPAPLMTIEEKNRSKKKWRQIDWSIWLHRPMQGRALKAECTCFVGMLALAGVGLGLYFATRDNEPPFSATTQPPSRALPRERSQTVLYYMKFPIFLPVAPLCSTAPRAAEK